MDLCIHEIDRSTCVYCNGRGADASTVDAVVIDTFSAHYPGRCARCDGPIRVGDRIGRLNDDQGYVCTRCLP